MFFQHLADALGPLSKEKDKLLNDHKLLKDKLNSEYEELAEQKRNYQQEIETLQKTASKIKEYDFNLEKYDLWFLNACSIDHLHSFRYYDLKKGERLKELQEKISVAESELRAAAAKKLELVTELNKSQDLMRNQDQLRRNIEDNLNYRKTKAEVDELASEIESLEENIVNTGGVSAIENKLKKLAEEKETLNSEVQIFHAQSLDWMYHCQHRFSVSNFWYLLNLSLKSCQ